MGSAWARVMRRDWVNRIDEAWRGWSDLRPGLDPPTVTPEARGGSLIAH